LWNRALDCDPNNDFAHFCLADFYCDQGNLDEAMAHFQKAVQIYPDFAEARGGLGSCLFQKGQVDEAISEYQKALKIRPHLAKTHNNLATALAQKGKLDEALSHYQQALQSDPKVAMYSVNAGMTLLQKNQPDEAIKFFQRALQIEPSCAPAHYNLAKALRMAGRTAEALRVCEEAIRSEPDDLQIQNQLAWMLATATEPSLRNGARAVELARLANERSRQGDPLILGTLAAALAETGDFADAGSTAKKAVDLALAAGRRDLADRLAAQRNLYEKNLPCRE
jgi:tetratricopeptide (TPR) repeat protein